MNGKKSHDIYYKTQNGSHRKFTNHRNLGQLPTFMHFQSDET